MEENVFIKVTGRFLGTYFLANIDRLFCINLRKTTEEFCIRRDESRKFQQWKSEFTSKVDDPLPWNFNN